MGLVEITSLVELLKFLPALVRVFKELDGLWEAGMSPADFIAALTNNFQKNTRCYGILTEGEVSYFIAMQRLSSTKACFWLLYVNKDKRLYTKNLLLALKSQCMRDGITSVEFTTTRITPSYERWVAKFGAQKHLITYKLEI